MANFLKALNDATASTANVATVGVTTLGDTIVAGLDGIHLGVENLSGRLEVQRDLEAKTRGIRFEAALVSRVADINKDLAEASARLADAHAELTANPEHLELAQDVIRRYA